MHVLLVREDVLLVREDVLLVREDIVSLKRWPFVLLYSVYQY